MLTETTKRQLTREAEQVQNGVLRYRRNKQREDEGGSGAGRALVERAVLPVKVAIEDMITQVEDGKAGKGRPAAVVAYLQHLQPETVAFLTARMTIAMAARNERLAHAATLLATQVEEHYRFEELRVEEPGLAIHMERKAKDWTAPYYRRAIMRRAADVADVVGLQWAKGDKLRLGMKLIEIFITKTGLAEQYIAVEGRNNTPYRLRLTAATAEWLDKQDARCEVLEPQFTPMICPPKPWTSAVSGGYLSPENRRDFVKNVSPQLRDELLSMELDDMFDAVNAVQETAWRINRAVYDVFAECWRHDEPLAGLPEQDPRPLPARPADIPKDLPRDMMPDDMKERFEAWRKATAMAHDENAELIGKRIATHTRMSMATDVVDEPAIYFPHNVDFRGRLYSLVPELNPQADDLGKGLLEFAKGKPLGSSGGYWLCVHLANCFGVDKVSFDDRVAWVQEHANELIDSACSPLDGHRYWLTADDPWCALAACFEFTGWQALGDDYVSHLPIAMDGSCSGLQHYSAMLRDADGGAAVNLTRTSAPADIYTQVMHKVEEELALSSEPIAKAWRGRVTRKIVKRPAMTFAYSVTSRGIRDQILDELRKAVGSTGQYLPGWENFEAASYIAPLVEAAIKGTVDRASEAMGWLRGAVKNLIDADSPVTWMTPLGFPVQQRYVRSNGVRFKVWFQGLRMTIQLRSDTQRPDRRRQSSAVAPNFVHSMDACHLMMVVNRMRDEGITNSFAMVHDSFGCHAADIDEMHYAIRDEFVRLYTPDRLGEFREQVLSRLPLACHEDVEETPHMGSLDLAGVYEADFFFS